MANILIIDDDFKIRQLLAQHAKEMNHNTAVAESLADGFEVAKLQAFDLIFLDVRLPDGNGLDVLPKFKQILEDLELVFDRIVLDCPPLSVSIDSAIVSSSTKLSLLVIDVKTCTRNMAQHALESFETLRIEPTGIILANIKIKKRESD